MKPIRHIAGPYEDGLQQCTRCLLIIHDHRDVLILNLNETDLRRLGFCEGRLVGFPVGSLLHFGGSKWFQDILYESTAVDCVPMDSGLEPNYA